MAKLIADPFRSARLVLALRRRGITNDGVLSALETIDRAAFVTDELSELAAEDCALPIPCGQTILRPLITAYMLRALAISPGSEQRVLLVGSGSGYTAVLLSQLCRHVYGVERYQRLAESSKKRLEELGVNNITVRHGDGLLGLPGHGPFERILLTGAVDAIPQVLLSQLTRQGLLVAPLVRESGEQNLVQYAPDGLISSEAMPERVAKLDERPAASL